MKRQRITTFPTGQRTELVVARKDHTCDTCKQKILKGHEYSKTTTPPWCGEAEGDYDEGHWRAYYINIHVWTTERRHLIVECPAFKTDAERFEAAYG